MKLALVELILIPPQYLTEWRDGNFWGFENYKTLKILRKVKRFWLVSRPTWQGKNIFQIWNEYKRDTSYSDFLASFQASIFKNLAANLLNYFQCQQWIIDFKRQFDKPWYTLDIFMLST